MGEEDSKLMMKNFLLKNFSVTDHSEDCALRVLDNPLICPLG